MNSSNNLIIGQIAHLSELGMVAEKAELLKIYYSGFCSLGQTEDLRSLFFTSLCDKMIIYNSKAIILKLIQINQSKNLYEDYYEMEISNILTFIQSLTDSNEDPDTKIQKFREYANSNITTFKFALIKVLSMSTFNNYNNAENKELRKTPYDKLYKMYYDGNNLNFSHFLALINDLGISVKVIFIDSMKIENYNQGQQVTLVFMKYSDIWFILYPTEDYYLLNSTKQESAEIMQMVQKKMSESKSTIQIHAPIMNKIKEKNEKAVQVIAKTFSLLYPNKTVFDIQEIECPELNLGEILNEYLCLHCFKLPTDPLQCGHFVCKDVLYSSRVNNTEICGHCNKQ